MNVTLTPRLEALIQQQVASGRFGDASAVIEEALKLLDQQDRVNRLRAALAVGIADFERGDFTTWTETTMDELIREADEDDRLGLPISDDVLP